MAKEIDKKAIDALHVALDGATSWSQVRSRLTEHESEEEPVPWRAFAFAFGFHLIEHGRDEWREREQSPFGAMVEWQEGGRFPPRLADVEDVDVAVWGQVLDEVGDDPIAASRLHDLLWERRAGDKPVIHAQKAIDAYVALSRNEAWSSVWRADFLCRAFELARRVSDSTRQGEVTQALVRIANEDLESSDGGPGVTLTAIRALTEYPADPDADLVLGLLARAEDRYGADPHVADSIADLRARFLTDEEAVGQRRKQIERWRVEAAKADGMLRVLWLQHARELAVAHGFRDLIDDLTSELQTIDPEDLDLKKVSADIEVPSDEVDAFIAQVVGDDSIDRAFARLGAQPPPGGQPDELRNEVDDEMRRHPLMYLIAHEVSGGPYNSAIYRALDEKAHRRLAVSHRRALSGRLWSVFAARVLDAMHESYGDVPREILTDHFESALISKAIAERFARAVELFWQGEYDECAHILVPRIEAAIRDIARGIGIPVIKLPDGPKPGGVLGLGAILFSLRGRFADPGWQEYLENLLSDPLGINLRNSVSHALTPLIGREDAALLIHAACFLANLGYTQRDLADGGPSDP